MSFTPFVTFSNQLFFLVIRSEIATSMTFNISNFSTVFSQSGCLHLFASSMRSSIVLLWSAKVSCNELASSLDCLRCFVRSFHPSFFCHVILLESWVQCNPQVIVDWASEQLIAEYPNRHVILRLVQLVGLLPVRFVPFGPGYLWKTIIHFNFQALKRLLQLCSVSKNFFCQN